MTTPLATRFDLGALRRLAGETVFARGQAYHRDGHVEILTAGPSRIVARVAGTEDYRIELTGRAADIGGDCSCPAFEDWGFCKHMVATALAVNALDEATPAEAGGSLERIRDHLLRQSVEVLVDMILDLAESDRTLFQRLDLAAAVTHADDKTLLARIRKVLDRATRTGGYVDYRGATDWAAGVDAVLESIAGLAAAGRGRVALDLVERAIDRIETAIGEIDDSDGHCGGLLERCAEIHLAAARIAKPEPVRLAADLFAREMADNYGAFGGAASLYAEVLGDEGLCEYRRLAAEAWAGLPPLSGATKDREASAGDYRALLGILDVFAEREGDVDGRIALRTKDLSSPWAYLQLAEFCLDQGRLDEALRRAEEGLWLFEDHRQDERLVRFTATLLSKANRGVEAEALLRRAFERAPSLELYARLRDCGQGAGDRAIAWLRAQLDHEPPSRWGHRADFLVRVLTEERAHAQAWDIVRKHGASLSVRETLALASEAAHPREAIAVYAERIANLAEHGGNPAYAQAADLVERMARLQGAAQQAAFVTSLKERFGRKRNFMKLLE